MVRMVSMCFYPWGVVEAPEGYIIREADAACGAEDHSSHPHCIPGWEKNLLDGAVVVAAPALDPDSGSGWIALVAIPPEAPLVGRPPAELRILASRLREDATDKREFAESIREELPEFAEPLLSTARRLEELADIAETGPWPPRTPSSASSALTGLIPKKADVHLALIWIAVAPLCLMSIVASCARIFIARIAYAGLLIASAGCMARQLAIGRAWASDQPRGILDHESEGQEAGAGRGLG